MTATIHDYRAAFECKRRMAEHARSRREEPPAIEVREETGWTSLLLAPGIGADEVRQALRGSGLVVVAGEGCATINRDIPPHDAA